MKRIAALLAIVCVGLALALFATIGMLNDEKETVNTLKDVFKTTVGSLKEEIDKRDRRIAELTVPKMISGKQFAISFPNSNEKWRGVQAHFRTRLAEGITSRNRTAQAERLLQKLNAIDGIVLVMIDQYSIEISKAEMFSWDELEGPITDIIRAEFPEEPSTHEVKPSSEMS